MSISAGFLAFACATKLGNPHQYGIGFFVFFSTLFVYNIQRIFRLNEVRIKQSVRHEWIIHHSKDLLILAVFSLLLSPIIYFVILGKSIDIWLIISGLCISVLYAYQPIRKLNALRDYPFIKIYLIALCWTFATILWPYIRNYSQAEPPVYLSISIFLFIIAATIPFDIRDLVYDSSAKHTIPQILGVKGSKFVSIILLLISAILLFIGNNRAIVSVLFYLTYFGMGALVMWTNQQRKEKYFSGIIDGWILLYALLIYTL